MVYATNRVSLNRRSTPISGVSGVNQYSVELIQLQHGTVYYFQVESTNTIGSTRSEIRSFEIQNACTLYIYFMTGTPLPYSDYRSLEMHLAMQISNL